MTFEQKPSARFGSTYTKTGMNENLNKGRTYGGGREHSREKKQQMQRCQGWQFHRLKEKQLGS